MSSVISNRIYIKDTPEVLDIIKEELTYKIPVGFGKNVKLKKECSYRVVGKDIISIPSGRVDLIPGEFKDKRIDDLVSFPEFKYSLRLDQAMIHDRVEGSCIINANPSWGKTFAGIAIASKLARKTLVIVHTKALLTQWKREVEKTLGITPGIITAGTCDAGPPIVITNIQTFRKKAQEFSKTFGTVIVDECHHTPSATFEKVLDTMHAKNKIGLSATLIRKDGRHVFLRDFFSPDIYAPKEETNRIDPYVLRLTLPVELGSSDKHYGERVADLYNNADYQQAVVNLANEAANQGHKVLVVSNRVEFLAFMHELLEETSVLVVGSTTNREKLIAEVEEGDKSIIFGTNSIFSEGISINILSCLLLAYPISNEQNLEQLVGRIARIHPDKLYPVVIDLILGGPTGQRQAAVRNKYYKSKDLLKMDIYFEDVNSSINLTKDAFDLTDEG